MGNKRSNCQLNRFDLFQFLFVSASLISNRFKMAANNVLNRPWPTFHELIKSPSFKERLTNAPNNGSPVGRKIRKWGLLISGRVNVQSAVDDHLHVKYETSRLYRLRRAFYVSREGQSHENYVTYANEMLRMTWLFFNFEIQFVENYTKFDRWSPVTLSSDRSSCRPIKKSSEMMTHLVQR